MVRGDVDAYVHAGGQYEWDNWHRSACATPRDCIAADSTGWRSSTTSACHTCRTFVICRREIADDVLSALDNVW